MIAAWMLYAVLVGGLVGSAAWLLERAVVMRGAATRCIWVASLLGSTLLVAVVYLRPGARVESDAPAFAGTVVTSVSAPALVRPGLLDQLRSAAFAADRPLVVFWLISILAVIAYIAVAQVILWRRRARWRTVNVDGVTLYVSLDVGPALVGLRAPRIVVPEWLLTCAAAQQQLVIAHEEAHARARDPQVLAFGLLLALLTPWNLALWWQLRRLRFAIEVDCDARVLQTHHDRRGYGELLVTVAARIARPDHLLLPATFSEPRSLLERRIEILSMKLPKFARARAVLLGALSLALIIAACFSPAPDKPSPTAPATAVGAARSDADPEFTPYTDPPELLNRAEVGKMLESEYPPLLRDAGIEGAAQVWVHIDPAGSVTDARIRESTGHAPLDSAALRTARRMQFSGAKNHTEAIAIWVALPILFKRSQPVGAVQAVPDDAKSAAASGNPEFTPFTDAPELLNRAEVGQALEESYPPLLRNAGIEGKAMLWVHINSNGIVTDARIKESSGHMPLDEAALRTARRMKFSGARNRGTPAAVWIVLPIAFELNAATETRTRVPAPPPQSERERELWRGAAERSGQLARTAALQLFPELAEPSTSGRRVVFLILDNGKIDRKVMTARYTGSLNSTDALKFAFPEHVGRTRFQSAGTIMLSRGPGVGNEVFLYWWDRSSITPR